MITPEQHAEIRRLHFGEHWKVGTIAAALGVHHDAVRAALAHDTQTLRRGTCRATMLDPYLPFLRDTVASWGWMVRAAPADMDLLRRCF